MKNITRALNLQNAKSACVLSAHILDDPAGPAALYLQSVAEYHLLTAMRLIIVVWMMVPDRRQDQSRVRVGDVSELGFVTELSGVTQSAIDR